MARKKNGAANDDDGFDQGGADGAAKQRGKGDNKRFEGKVLAEMLETIAAAKARCKKRLDAAKKANEGDRTLIKDAKGDLIEDSYPARELNLMIKLHELELQKQNIDSELDDEGKETLQEMRDALGGMADMPLGQAAMSRHPDAPH